MGAGTSALKGAQGERGLTGATGKTGDKGVKGDKGDKGDIGLTGARGEKGDKGDRGEKGEKGDTGMTGKDGPVGSVSANNGVVIGDNFKLLPSGNKDWLWLRDAGTGREPRDLDVRSLSASNTINATNIVSAGNKMTSNQGEFNNMNVRSLTGNLITTDGLRVNQKNGIEFGVGVAGKQADAGKMGYGMFTGDAVDIVGGGTENFKRKVVLWDTLEAKNTLTAPNINSDNLTVQKNIKSEGYVGPFQLQVYQLNNQCVDAGQFGKDQKGVFTCDPNNNWQKFYYSPFTGHLKNVQTGLCLDRNDNNVWGFSDCSDHPNLQFWKNGQSLQWNKDTCFDANSTTRNFNCNDNSNQRIKWLYRP